MIHRHKEGELLRWGFNIGRDYIIPHLGRWGWFGYDRLVGWVCGRLR